MSKLKFYVVGVVFLVSLLQLVTFIYFRSSNSNKNYPRLNIFPSNSKYSSSRHYNHENGPIKLLSSYYKDSSQDDDKKEQLLNLKEDLNLDLFQTQVSIALVFFDLSNESQIKLVEFFKYMQEHWSRFKFYIITHAPKLTEELIQSNHVKNDIIIFTTDLLSNSMGANFAKSHIYRLFNPDESLKEILFIDHRFNIYRDILPVVQAGRLNCNRDILLFRNGDYSKHVLSSKVLLVRRKSSKDFFRLWGNFMEVMSFKSKTDDEEALDFTFFAEGYTDIDSMAGTQSKEALDYCLIKGADHLLIDTPEPLNTNTNIVQYLKEKEPPTPQFSGLKDMNGQPMDYLIAIKVVSCTAKQAVQNINKYQSPQRIVYMVVFPHTCRTLLSFGDNVRCIWENHVIPGFSKKFIQDISPKIRVKERAGWYLLQMMNLYASNFEGLSEHYVVWDADGVPIYKIPHMRNGKAVFYTGDEHDWSTSVGYHRSYTILTGYNAYDPMDHPSPEYVEKGRPTWVAHFMVFKKEYVKEFLNRIAEFRNVPADKWMYEIIKIVNAHEQSGLQRVGFGEYDAYGHWVNNFHKDYFEVDLESWKTCSRLYKAPEDYKDDCCIPESLIEKLSNEGIHYIVREYGSGRCDLTEAN